MIRVCKEADKEVLAEYLKDEPYGKAIAAALEAFGVDAPFETVYIDEERAERVRRKKCAAYISGFTGRSSFTVRRTRWGSISWRK